MRAREEERGRELERVRRKEERRQRRKGREGERGKSRKEVERKVVRVPLACLGVVKRERGRRRGGERIVTGNELGTI